MIKRHQRHSGFTFIEIMAVLVIIGLLVSLALPRYFQGLKRGQEAALREDLGVMRKAIDHYYADKNAYPSHLQTLVEEQYLKFIPEDPLTESTETWQTVMPPDNSNHVYDVHSGSLEIATDGTPYNSW